MDDDLIQGGPEADKTDLDILNLMLHEEPNEKQNKKDFKFNISMDFLKIPGKEIVKAVGTP